MADVSHEIVEQVLGHAARMDATATQLQTKTFAQLSPAAQAIELHALAEANLAFVDQHHRSSRPHLIQIAYYALRALSDADAQPPLRDGSRP